MGVAYILDEPSIGLHQRDNDKLLKTLIHLRDLGNSVLVVEHDEDTMLAADCIVDIGPGAGEHGGQVIAMGTAKQIMANKDSITGAYLSGRMAIPVPSERRKPSGWITVPDRRPHTCNPADQFPCSLFQQTLLPGPASPVQFPAECLGSVLLYLQMGNTLNLLS